MQPLQFAGAIDSLRAVPILALYRSGGGGV